MDDIQIIYFMTLLFFYPSNQLSYPTSSRNLQMPLTSIFCKASEESLSRLEPSVLFELVCMEDLSKA